MGCLFCAVVGLPASERPPQDRMLLASPGFEIIPAVGPLVVGHVMAISTRHETNLLSSAGNAIRDYDNMLAATRYAVRQYTVGMLEAEHGGVEGERSGSCITHTHVNLLPGFSHHLRMFDGILPLLAEITGMLPVVGSTQPYILLRSDGQARLYDARNVPSQLIRRRICELRGDDDWDWAVHAEPETMAQTLAVWSTAGTTDV